MHILDPAHKCGACSIAFASKESLGLTQIVKTLDTNGRRVCKVADSITDESPG
jgi:hypothetical protein